MALSAFDDKTRPPGASELRATLGKAYSTWEALRKDIAARFAPLHEQWGFASKSTGWGLRLIQEKRTVLYMTPCEGYFLASFALGEKAVKAARAGDLPAAVVAAIEGAKKYAEGRGVRLEVRTAAEARAIRRLAEIKMAN